MGTNNKLREALDLVDEGFTEGCLDAPGDCPTKHDLHRVSVIRKKVKSALAEPVKNCEVGTVAEQAKRFEEYCESEVCKRKRCKSRAKALCIERCALEWAQKPYKEGGAK